jgi:PPIC-type PPIASE domain
MRSLSRAEGGVSVEALCLLALLVWSLIVGGCGGGGGHPLAEVGTVRITETTLDHWVDVNKALDGTAFADRRDVLSALITLAQGAQAAAEYGVRVSDSEAHQSLSLLTFEDGGGAHELGLTAEEPGLRHLLTSSALTESDRVWLVKAQMLALRLRQRLSLVARQRVSQTQIASYYRLHKRQFVVPEKRDMEIFLTYGLSEAQQGKREIIEGRSFKEVAKLRNVSYEGGHDGLVMGLARGAGEPAFEKYVFGAKPHVLLGPIAQVLFYVFRITKITPARPQSLAKVEPEIRRRLAAEKASSLMWEEVSRRWLMRTRCDPLYIVAGCGAP